jgi:hypothetical protein
MLLLALVGMIAGSLALDNGGWHILPQMLTRRSWEDSADGLELLVRWGETETGSLQHDRLSLTRAQEPLRLQH